MKMDIAHGPISYHWYLTDGRATDDKIIQSFPGPCHGFDLDLCHGDPDPGPPWADRRFRFDKEPDMDWSLSHFVDLKTQRHG